mgnify:CR=1 FL=1
MSYRRPVWRPALNRHPRLVAGFSTRHGGVSTPPYASLNVAHHVGDQPDRVSENRRRVCEALAIAPDRLATAEQVHGSTVRTVAAPGHTADCDALVTTTPHLYLAVLTADCAAVLLADPDAGVIGACHAGWRGTVARIVPNTLNVMQQQGASLARIRAYISPCIGVEAFEVGPEVAAQFDASVVDTSRGSRPHVDLTHALQRQLQEAGLSADHVEADTTCTARSRDLYSYRADGPTTGRMMGVIGWHPDPDDAA